MHSNIYSRDEMLHHRSSFDLYATALKPCGSSAILARARVIKRSSSASCCSLSVQACGLRP